MLNVILAWLLLVPITPESGRFSILRDGKRVGVEEYTIAARGSGWVVDGKTQLDGDPSPLSSRMELDEKLNLVSYEYRHGSAALRVRVDKPTSEFVTITDGKESSTDFRLPDGAFIVDNNFFHHYLLLLYRVGSGGSTLPIFVPQDMRVGQASVRSRGSNVYELQMGDVRLEATADANGRLMRLSVPDAGVVVER